MGMLEQFQKLDGLIIDHTEPPVRTTLRNQLALTREQVEAYQSASDSQDQTLAAQIEAITGLQKEKADLAKRIIELENQIATMRSQKKDEFYECLAREQEEQRKILQRHTLDHNF